MKNRTLFSFPRLALVAGLLTIASAGASAAALCTSFIGTAISSIGSCDIQLTIGPQSFTVNFSSFTNAPTGVLSQVDSSNATGQAGLQFVGTPAGTPLAAWTNFSYTAQITSACNVGFDCFIIGQYQQAAYGSLVDLTGTLSFSADTCGVPGNLTPGSSTYGPTLCTANIAGADTVTTTYDPGNNTLNNFETDVYVGAVGNTVPEPTTFVLLGAGMGVLGLLRRRSVRR